MNRKEAIMGIATIAAAAAVPSVASAQKPEAEAENPELEPIRALLKAYDTAFTNHDLDGVMATMSEKAAIMGSGPGEIWSKRPINIYLRDSTLENKVLTTSSTLAKSHRTRAGC